MTSDAYKIKPVVAFLQQEVIRNLVKRYVAAMIRSAKTDEGLTEENFKVGTLKVETRVDLCSNTAEHLCSIYNVNLS